VKQEKSELENVIKAYALTNCSVIKNINSNYINLMCVEDLSNDDLNYIEEHFNKQFSKQGIYYKLSASGLLIHKSYLMYYKKACYMPFNFMGIPVIMTTYEQNK